MIQNAGASRGAFEMEAESVKKYIKMRHIGKEVSKREFGECRSSRKLILSERLQLEVRILEWFEYLWSQNQNLSDE